MVNTCWRRLNTRSIEQFQGKNQVELTLICQVWQIDDQGRSLQGIGYQGSRRYQDRNQGSRPGVKYQGRSIEQFAAVMLGL
jgi:hypothetical protein